MNALAKTAPSTRWSAVDEAICEERIAGGLGLCPARYAVRVGSMPAAFFHFFIFSMV